MGGQDDETRTGRELVREFAARFRSEADAARFVDLGPHGRQRLNDFLHRRASITGERALRLADAVGIPLRAVLFPDVPLCQFAEWTALAAERRREEESSR